MADHGRDKLSRSRGRLEAKKNRARKKIEAQRNTRLWQKTRRFLPLITLANVIALATAGVVGIYMLVMILRLPVRKTTFMNVNQTFVVVSSSLSLLYVVLHLVCAYRNEPVGLVRPPVLKLHASCFVVARLSLMGWVATVIAMCIVVAKPSTCVRGTPLCNYQIADLAAAACAILTTGTLLTILDYARYPFALPLTRRPSSTSTSRMSGFEEEFFCRSANNSTARLIEHGDAPFARYNANVDAKASKESIGRAVSEKSSPSSHGRPSVPVLARLKALEAAEALHRPPMPVRSKSMPTEHHDDVVDQTARPERSPNASPASESRTDLIVNRVVIPDFPLASASIKAASSRSSPEASVRSPVTVASPVKAWGHAWQHLAVRDSIVPPVTTPIKTAPIRARPVIRPHLKSLSTADSAISINSSRSSIADPFSASPSTAITTPSAVFSPVSAGAADMMSPASSISGETPVSPQARQRVAIKQAAIAASGPTQRSSAVLRSPLRTMSLAAMSTPNLNSHARPRAPSIGRGWTPIPLPIVPSAAMTQPSMRGSIVGGGSDNFGALPAAFQQYAAFSAHSRRSIIGGSAHLPGYYPGMGAGVNGGNASVAAAAGHRRSMSAHAAIRSPPVGSQASSPSKSPAVDVQAQQQRKKMAPPRLPLAVRPAGTSTPSAPASVAGSASSSAGPAAKSAAAKETTEEGKPSLFLPPVPPVPPLPSPTALEQIVTVSARQRSVRRAQYTASASASPSKAGSLDLERSDLPMLSKSKSAASQAPSHSTTTTTTATNSRKPVVLSRKERLHAEGKGKTTLRSKSARNMRSFRSTTSVALTTFALASSSSSSAAGGAASKRASGELKLPRMYVEYRGSMGERVEKHTQRWEMGIEKLIRERQEAEQKEKTGAVMMSGGLGPEIGTTHVASMVKKAPEEVVEAAQHTFAAAFAAAGPAKKDDDDDASSRPVPPPKTSRAMPHAGAGVTTTTITANDTSQPAGAAEQAQAQAVAREEERIEHMIMERRRAGKDRLRRRMKERAVTQAKRASGVGESVSGLMRKASGKKKRVSLGMMLGLVGAGKNMKAVEETAEEGPEEEVEVEAVEKVAFRPLSLGLGLGLALGGRFSIGLGLGALAGEMLAKKEGEGESDEQGTTQVDEVEIHIDQSPTAASADPADEDEDEDETEELKPTERLDATRTIEELLSAVDDIAMEVGSARSWDGLEYGDEEGEQEVVVDVVVDHAGEQVGVAV